MELVVDLATKEVTLRDDDDLTRFSVRAIPRPGKGSGCVDLSAVAQALEARSVGTVDPDGHALIPPAEIRRLARESSSGRRTTVGQQWDDGFSSMLEYAASKGWVAADGAVRAHIEWGS